MCYSGADAAEVRKSLKLKNLIVGYVFLLDTKGRIRWRAHATPTSRELEALVACTRKLVEDFKL